MKRLQVKTSLNLDYALFLIIHTLGSIELYHQQHRKACLSIDQQEISI